MDDLSLPYILWLSGNPQPDLTSLLVPVAIPVRYHSLIPHFAQHEEHTLPLFDPAAADQSNG
jgi:hypothetical protein